MIRNRKTLAPGTSALAGQVAGDVVCYLKPILRSLGVDLALAPVVHEARAGGEERHGRPDLSARVASGGDELYKGVEPGAELLEAVLARVLAMQRGLVLLKEAEHVRAVNQDRDVAREDLVPGGRSWLLLRGPLDERVQPGEVVLGEAADDVFLGLEVVVQRCLGDAEALGDLAQGGPLVALLGEQLQRDALDAGPVSPRAPLATWVPWAGTSASMLVVCPSRAASSARASC